MFKIKPSSFQRSLATFFTEPRNSTLVPRTCHKKSVFELSTRKKRVIESSASSGGNTNAQFTQSLRSKKMTYSLHTGPFNHTKPASAHNNKHNMGHAMKLNGEESVFRLPPVPLSSAGLPLLDALLEQLSSSDLAAQLKDVCLISVQHLLPTTVNLFKALIALGFAPQNILLMGKAYSSEPDSIKALKQLGIYVQERPFVYSEQPYEVYAQRAVTQLWRRTEQVLVKRQLKQLVILDEGGRLIDRLPRHLPNHYAVAAIEQTRVGLYSKEQPFLQFPIVNVAQSAVKREFESTLIADKLVQALKRHVKDLANKQLGVVGTGAIGRALIAQLVREGWHVYYTDNQDNAAIQHAWPSAEKAQCLPSIAHVLSNSDCLLSCTGTDISDELDIFNLSSDKSLISCSSEDKEFRKLLRTIQYKTGQWVELDPLQTITVKSKRGARVQIVAGGFPVNFDKTQASDNKQMSLTRGLLLAACYQATQLLQRKQPPRLLSTPYVMLEPELQRQVLLLWQKDYPELVSEGKLTQCLDESKQWVETQSAGAPSASRETPPLPGKSSVLNPASVGGLSSD